MRGLDLGGKLDFGGEYSDHLDRVSRQSSQLGLWGQGVGRGWRTTAYGQGNAKGNAEGVSSYEVIDQRS